MAQNKKTSEIIRKFGTFEMCNTPEEIKRWRDSNGQYELCSCLVHSGVIGCGKSTTLAQALGIYCLEAQQRGLTGLRIVLAGVSQKRVKENFCNALIKAWGAGPEGYHETHSGKNGYRDAELFGQWLYIIDIKDKGAEERIRGLSDIVGIVFEELSLIEEQKYLMLLGRQRKSLTAYEKERWPANWLPFWSVGSTNPDGPQHWILKHVADGRMKLIAWGMQDACYPEAKQLYKRWINLYKDSPVIYKRNLKGLWVANDKAVYMSFNLKRHTYTNSEAPDGLDYSGISRSFLAVDAGSSHPTALLYISKSMTGQYIVSRELRITHTAPSEICRAIGLWYDEIKSRQGYCIVYVDPAAAWLKDEMTKFGIDWHNAENKHLNGINYIRGLLGSDMLLINRDECPELVGEFGSYQFKNEDSDDVIKVGDDFVDSCRYGCYTDYLEHQY